MNETNDNTSINESGSNINSTSEVNNKSDGIYYVNNTPFYGVSVADWAMNKDRGSD